MLFLNPTHGLFWFVVILRNEIKWNTNLIEETSILMESETDLLWLASNCQVGGSLGLTAKDLAVSTMEQDPSIIACPEEVMGSWDARAAKDIFAGTLVNSGLLAKVHKLSTASSRGLVASPVFWRFLSLYSWSRVLISLTRLAVELATSFADCTKWRLATGLVVLEDARRQALQRALVCFAISVAAKRI